MLHSASVMCDLLQSCYTGVLQFKPEEIVNYLTAASYLQMECIVERCRDALKKYMQLKNPNLLKVSHTKSVVPKRQKTLPPFYFSFLRFSKPISVVPVVAQNLKDGVGWWQKV